MRATRRYNRPTLRALIIENTCNRRLLELRRLVFHLPDAEELARAEARFRQTAERIAERLQREGEWT